jgi:tetratricopeptide (TPR) repeat protein
MAHALLGVAYQNVFDNEHAEQHFREAAARVSRLPETEREKILGDFNMIRRNYDEACPHYDALVTLRPRDPAGFLVLGYCSARRLDFARAISATTKAHEMAPSLKTRLNLALVSLLSGDAEKARAMTEALDKEMPPNGQLGYVEGKALIALGRLGEARALYMRMVAAGGEPEIEGHAGLADLARASGRRDEARRELEAERTAASHRDNTYSAAIAAAGLAELAAEDASRDGVRTALAQAPVSSTDIQVLYRIGRAWARGGDTAQASAILARMDVVAPEHSRQFDALKAMLRAEIALASKDTARAIKEADTAVDFHPSGAALDTLGRARLAAGRPSDAAKSFEQFLRRPGERCDSDDAPACYRVSDVRAWLRSR